MAELSSYERVMRVLDGAEPDRIPHFEWLFAKNVREAILPGCTSHNDFAVRMGHDAVLVGPDFGKEQVGPTQWRSEWGYVNDYGQQEHGVEVESPIKSTSDFEAYIPPNPQAPGRYETVEWAVREFKGDKAIGVHLNDVFSIPRALVGMENLLMTIALDPELTKALVDMSVEVNLAMAKEVAARGVDFIWTGDDYACNTGPMMSPDSFRELFYPGLRRVIGGFRELGLPVIKHTDGYLWPIIDMIIDSGISCLDPIDPQAGMDISEVKEKYGDRVALKGNVDCAQTLSYATVEEVIEETKQVIRKGGPGGGFILSSSNSIHASVKPENYMAMPDTLKEFGRYPLRV